MPTGSAEKIPPNETEAMSLGYPITTPCLAFVDHLPIDFTIKTSEKQTTNISGFAVSGLYRDTLKYLILN